MKAICTNQKCRTENEFRNQRGNKLSEQRCFRCGSPLIKATFSYDGDDYKQELYKAGNMKYRLNKAEKIFIPVL